MIDCHNSHAGVNNPSHSRQHPHSFQTGLLSFTAHSPFPLSLLILPSSVRLGHRLDDGLAAQPLVLRDEVPAEDAEDGDRTEDHAGKVERLGIRDGEVERRNVDLGYSS